MFTGAGRVFIGENAQGKTSLLEAICVLLRLQSPRARQLSQVIREGERGFGLKGEAWGRELRVQGVGRKISLQADGEERSSRREYLKDGGLVVWMGNEDLDLVRGGGESRRRFLDFVGMQVSADYREHWSRYRKALKARNRYLKTMGPGEGAVRAYTAMLLEHGTALITFRKGLCEEMSPLLAGNQAGISGRAEELSLEYRDRSKGDLAAAFEEAAESEARRGVTLVGPHRDDLKLTISGRSVRDYASEGQQRTVALSLKLAQGEILKKKRGEEPVYLIDDVFGELDPGRRNALLERLPEGAQKVITTTHLDWLKGAGLGMEVSTVKDGAVL